MFEDKIIISTIFYNLSPSLIVKLSPINKSVNNLCKDEYFWQQYCKKNYFVIDMNSHCNYKYLYNWKDTALLCEETLNLLFNKQIYPSYRFLNIYIMSHYIKRVSTLGTLKYFSKRIIDFTQNIVGIERISLYCTIGEDNTIDNYYGYYRYYNFNEIILLVKDIKIIDKRYKLSYDESYNIEELSYIKDLMKVIMVSTLYFYPGNDENSNVGFKNIEYDIDVLNYVFNHEVIHYYHNYELIKENICDKLSSYFRKYGKMMFLKHFI